MLSGHIPQRKSPSLVAQATEAFSNSRPHSESSTGNLFTNTLDFAPNLLESLIPGYAIISKFIYQIFGFDIGVFVSVGLLVVTFSTALRFIFGRAQSFLLQYGVSSIFISDHDDMFDNILSWIGEQRVGKEARSLQAISKSIGVNDEDELEDNEELFKTQLFHTGRMAKVPPKYEPYFGSYYFFRNGRLFIFQRDRREQSTRMPWERTAPQENVIFKIVGWSTQPIKDLLRDIKAWAADNKTSFTVIRRPNANMRERGRQGLWTKELERPSRPMETVVLEPEQKARLIADVHEYLLPSTRKWYAGRGIPYRRGYLFHGPPGTGKSSLSFALAGLFGLDVFLISLLEPSLTESDLIALFNALPRRCIVLLEDIDAAGLKRKAGPAIPDKTSDNSRRGKKTDSSSGAEEPPVSAGISLSGLLNAIDGVSSHEGHVLVMTSNFPEKLDPALIRPGRVDMKIEFTLASAHQIREIFYRMYSNETNTEERISTRNPKILNKPSSPPIASQPISSTKNSVAASTNIGISTQELLRPMLEKKEATYTRADLQDLAAGFVSKVPEKLFSPAEVQNFLIPRKKDPWKSTDDVEAWVEEMLRAKALAVRMQEESSPEDKLEERKEGNGALSNGHTVKPLALNEKKEEKVNIVNIFPPTPTSPEGPGFAG